MLAGKAMPKYRAYPRVELQKTLNFNHQPRNKMSEGGQHVSLSRLGRFKKFYGTGLGIAKVKKLLCHLRGG